MNKPVRNDDKIIWWQIIGKGTFGEVWKAEWKGKRRTENKSYKQCAVKKMDISNPENFQLVKREINVWKELNHPNIVEFYEEFWQGPYACLFMEYLVDGSLYNYMVKHGAHNVDLSLVLAFGLDICNAVKYIHGLDIVHRDIKPGNLLLARSENGTYYLKLCDYGLAREFLNVDLLSAVGTKFYMAPEFLRHRTADIMKPKNERTKGPETTVVLSKTVDIYSIGVVLNELPTFREPFDDFGKGLKGIRPRGKAWKKSDFYLFMSKLPHNTATNPLRPTRARDINPDTPAEFQQLLEECWTDTPELRPSINDVIERLEGIQRKLVSEGFQAAIEGASLRPDDIPVTVPPSDIADMPTGGKGMASEIAPQPTQRLETNQKEKADKPTKQTKEQKNKEKSTVANRCRIQ